MAQADYSIANASGAVVRADINDQLEAIATNNSGATGPSDTFPHMWWFDASTNLLKQRNAANTDWVTVASKSAGVWVPYRDGLAIPAWGTSANNLVQLDANGFLPAVGSLEAGQALLFVASATELRLSRRNGRFLFINGTFESVPEAGVTIDNSGLSADTLYYVYAFMDNGTMTLELSTTSYVTDSTYGIRVKDGDPTRTLVGLSRTDAATQFLSRFTVSQYQRRRKSLTWVDGGNQTTGSTSQVPIGIGLDFVCWGDSDVSLAVGASVECTGTNSFGVGMFVDGTPPAGARQAVLITRVNVERHDVWITHNMNLSDGRHTLGPSFGNVTGGATLTALGGSIGATVMWEG